MTTDTKTIAAANSQEYTLELSANHSFSSFYILSYDSKMNRKGTLTYKDIETAKEVFNSTVQALGLSFTLNAIGL